MAVGPSDRALLDGESRASGQSDVVAVVLLVGMVIVGATLVLATGSVLLDDVQSASERQVVLDTATSTHYTVDQVIANGDARTLPGAGEGSVDVRVEDSGTMSVELLDGDTGSVCGRDVEVSLGAVIHERGDERVVYEGGGVWEVTEAGLAVRRAPPIRYDGERAHVAVQSVSAETGGDVSSGTVRANHTQSRAVAAATEELLQTCPQTGHTDLQISVTSQYAAAWHTAFEQRLDGDEVRVTRSGDTVRALIGNATEPAARGDVRLADIAVPDNTITPSESFTVDVTVANDGSDPVTGELELELDGTSVSDDATVIVAGGDRTTATLRIDNNEIDVTQERGTLASYELSVRVDGDAIATVPGAFVYADQVANLTLAGASQEHRADGERVVTATVQNLGARAGTTPVTLSFSDPAVADEPVEIGPVDVPAGHSTDVTLPLDVSGLPVGTYEYQIGAAGETLTRTLTVRESDGASGAPLDRLRVTGIDPVDSTVERGEPFAVDVTLANAGDSPASGDVTLDVAKIGDVERSASVAPGDSETVRVTASAGAIETLRTGDLHEYDVIVTEGGSSVRADGTVYLGERGAAPRVHAASHDVGEELTIEATVANDGLVESNAPVELQLVDANTGEQVVSESTAPVTLPRGATTELAFTVPTARLSGTYEYELSYGGDDATGTVELDGVEEGDDGVTTTVAGEGTVTVLGTEVSYEQSLGGDTWAKYWAPVSVAVQTERDGDTAVHPIENPATAPTGHDARNLNTYDTQTEPARWRWEQEAGETVHLQLQSQLWERSGFGDYRRVNERHGDGPGYEDRTYRDYHPPADAWYRPAVSVDASAGENPDNVRVLRDGDEVPEIRRGYPDQRSAAEVLNQGAAHRIDPETGELELGPNEAVFLFEVTDQREYATGTWEAARERDDEGDPNFNDVIALVEFDAAVDGQVDVSVSVDDSGDGLTVALPDADSGEDDGSVTVDAPEVDTAPAEEAAQPEPPTPEADGAIERGDVEIDVGHVVIG